MRRRNRQPPAPARTPHPDPRTEVKLQQILSLRRAASRNDRQLDELNASLANLTETVGRHPGRDYHLRRLEEIRRLNGEIRRLNRENAELHDQIAELCAKLDDSDLAFLGAEP